MYSPNNSSREPLKLDELQPQEGIMSYLLNKQDLKRMDSKPVAKPEKLAE